MAGSSECDQVVSNTGRQRRLANTRTAKQQHPTVAVEQLGDHERRLVGQKTPRFRHIAECTE
jgi:hypothetical protein